MNKQEAFEMAVTRFAEQGEPCTTEDGKCVYLNDKGRRCIFGLLVPDEYIETLRGCEVTAFSLLRQDEFANIRDYFLAIDSDLIFWAGLQTLHDTNSGLYNRCTGETPYIDIRDKVVDFAQKHGLDTAFLDNVDFTQLQSYQVK